MKSLRLLPGLLLALCLFGLAALWLRLHHAASDLHPSVSAFTQVWSTPVSGFRDAALSPDGGTVAVADSAPSAVGFWRWQSQPGQPAWTRKIPGADSVAVSADGNEVLAWAALSPNQPTLLLLRGSDGVPISKPRLDGALWDVQVSPDGQFAGVETGGKSLYLFALGASPRFHRWPLGGYGNSVAFTAAGSYLVSGTWDESSVSCYTFDGVGLWQYPETPEERQTLSDRLFEAQFSGNGRYVLGLSYANVRQADPTLYFWRTEGGGKLLWKSELGDDAFFPEAQVTEDGRRIAVSYLRQVTRGDQTLSERRLRILDSDGNLLWERGGLLFSPILVALAPDGQRIIVSDGQRTLYCLNGDGRILASASLPGTIRRTIVSSQSDFLLAYTGDGTLTLFQLH